MAREPSGQISSNPQLPSVPPLVTEMIFKASQLLDLSTRLNIKKLTRNATERWTTIFNWYLLIERERERQLIN